MSAAQNRIFLEQRIYRRRRLIDAIKLLPILACALFCMPAVMASGDGITLTSTLLVFYILAWVAVIVVAALLTRALARNGDPDQNEETAPPGGGA